MESDEFKKMMKELVSIQKLLKHEEDREKRIRLLEALSEVEIKWKKGEFCGD